MKLFQDLGKEKIVDLVKILTDREGKKEVCALADLACRPDLASMAVDDALYDGEADSRPFVFRAAVEALESLKKLA